MRGFLYGTLTLVILQVVLQPGAVSKAGTASAILVGGLRRLGDPNYGGIPDATKGARPGLAPPPANSPAQPSVVVPGRTGVRSPMEQF